MNLHSRVLFGLVKSGVDRFVPTPTTKIPAPSAPAEKKLPTVDLSYAIPDLIVPTSDEDVPARSPFLRKIIHLNNRYSPLRDPKKLWNSPEDGRRLLNERFGNYLPESRVDWKGHDPTSDRVVEWWGLAGFGAIELRRLTQAESEKESARDAVPTYVSEYEFLGQFEVRKDLAAYGGDCFFNESGKVVKIKLHGRDYFPRDGNDWEFAKFAYRSSGLFWATVYHHLFISHYNISNISSLSTYKHLAPDHSLRHFLKPFIFRSAAINGNSHDTLLPRGSIIHRASALTWSGLHDAFAYMRNSFVFKSFPDQLQAKGLSEIVPDSSQDSMLAYRQNGLSFWNVTNDFINDVVENSSLFEKPVSDDATKSWWEEINRLSGDSLGTLTHANLGRYLTDFLFSVSGFHSFVGHVTPFVQDPRMLSTKIMPGNCIADCQTSEQISVIASITGLPMPKLVENFSHLMPSEDLAQKVMVFNQRLMDLNTDLTDRNAKRDIPAHAFLPETMGLSVSI